MGTIIYMALLGEGTGCWRPVRAERVADDAFEVVDQIPPDESWKFGPDSRVRCRERIFSGSASGLEAFEYAVESDPHYQLLKKHEQEIFRMVFASGEESVVKVLHVDEQYEDFIYDLLSTNFERDHYRAKSDAVYVARFADLVSARLEA